jgi:hypothetical protein
MPSIIDELREKQRWEEPKRSSPVPLILGVMVAFAVGGVAAFGYLKMPSLPAMKAKSAATEGTAAPDASAPTAAVSFAAGQRVGRAETAPLLRSCVPMSKLGFNGFDAGPAGQRIEAKDIYAILQAGAQVSRIAAVAGVKQQAVVESEFASIWGDVADCVFRQNGWALCDPDNRALTVEATNTFIRQVNIASSAKPEPPSSKPGSKTFAQVKAEIDGRHAPNSQQTLQAARAVKDRVLAGLRSRAAEGRLIASDFGYFAPAEVQQVFKDVKPTRNACAEK